MAILAFSCSTATATVGLLQGSTFIDRTNPQPRVHTEVLHRYIQELLNQAKLEFKDIQLIAVDPGPGSFTGIRVAVNVARTLCYTLKCPVLPITSLTALSADIGPSLVLINAYKNLVFTQAFVNRKAVGSPKVLSPAEVEAFAAEQFANQDYFVSGDGTQAYPGHFSKSFLDNMNHSGKIHPSAQDMIHISQTVSKLDWLTDWNFILPLYLRASAAEENLRK